MLVKLAPRHRAKLASLLAATSEFTPAEVSVALELVDCALGDPTSDDYRFVVCEEAERLLGYGCFGATPMTEGCFDLYWLVVGTRERRGGVGREVLRAIEGLAKGSGARLLRVETSGIEPYAAARAFYEGTGYRQVARIEDFYWPGNDLCIYTKYL